MIRFFFTLTLGLTLILALTSCKAKTVNPPAGYQRTESRKIDTSSTLLAEIVVTAKECPGSQLVNDITSFCQSSKEYKVEPGDILTVTPDGDFWTTGLPGFKWVRVTGLLRHEFEGVKYESPKVFWVPFDESFTIVEKTDITSVH